MTRQDGSFREADNSEVRDKEIDRLRGQLRATQVVMAIVGLFVGLDFSLPGGFGKVSASYSASGGRVLVSAEHDAAGMTVRSVDDTLRELLVAKKDSDSALILYDPQGKPRAEVSVQAGGPGIRLRDPNGKLRMELCVEGEACKMSMFDENGRVVWSAP